MKCPESHVHIHTISFLDQVQNLSKHFWCPKVFDCFKIIMCFSKIAILMGIMDNCWNINRIIHVHAHGLGPDGQLTMASWCGWSPSSNWIWNKNFKILNFFMLVLNFLKIEFGFGWAKFTSHVSGLGRSWGLVLRDLVWNWMCRFTILPAHQYHKCVVTWWGWKGWKTDQSKFRKDKWKILWTNERALLSSYSGQILVAFSQE